MSTKLEQLRGIYSDMLSAFPGGLSNTSTRKFDDIKKFFAEWLSLSPDDIYATGAGTRPGNLEVRLSQGLQATRHTKLGLAFLYDNLNTPTNRSKLTASSLVTIKKFLGRGKSHYDAILLLIQGDNNLYVTNIAYKSEENFVSTLMNEFELTGFEIPEQRSTAHDLDSDSNEIERGIYTSYPYLIGRENNTIDIEEESSSDDESQLMVRPFNPSLINIDTRYLTIDLLIQRLAQTSAEIDLSPEFQRNPNLWDNAQKSRLIESILIRFPLPAFYFDGSNKSKWLVVDGLQRLWTLKSFIVDKSLRLSNLEFLHKINGLTYDELDRDLQRTIQETQIVAYIINPGTPDDVKFNIFKRINTGGLVLEPQEIRHALYQGEPAKFVANLANSSEFISATGGSISPQRMLDRDFVNRFLAFYMFGYENYEPDLDTFMSKALGRIYRMSAVDKDKCTFDFLSSMKLNYEVFGQYAFRKIDGSGSVKPINKALFDVFSVLFAKLDESEITLLRSNAQKVINKLIETLNTDTTFWDSITNSTGSKGRVFYRFYTTEQLIKEILNS